MKVIFRNEEQDLKHFIPTANPSVNPSVNPVVLLELIPMLILLLILVLILVVILVLMLVLILVLILMLIMVLILVLLLLLILVLIPVLVLVYPSVNPIKTRRCNKCPVTKDVCLFNVNNFSWIKCQYGKVKCPHCIECIASRGVRSHVKRLLADKTYAVFTYCKLISACCYWCDLLYGHVSKFSNLN